MALHDVRTDPETTTRTPRPAPRPPAAPIRRRRERNRIAFAILVLVALLVTAPFVELLISALTPGSEIGADRWLPSMFRWANISDAIDYIPYWDLTRNSVFLATLSGVLTTFSSAITGYGFARMRGPGKKFLFGVLIMTMMVPPIVTLIPTYLLFSRYGLVGTYLPWVFWGAAGTPYTIFLYRQFFSSMPKELEEAAIIDGAGRIRIFVQIFLPLSRPLLVTAFVLAFNAVWGDFVAPDLFLNSSNTTLAVGVSSGYTNQAGYPLYNLLASGAMLYVIPVVLLFLFAQRSYVRGFANSGLKG
ncbi:carbohydrate ABC transporter permease [Actinospica sp. MGRD01-02]|uniref:Carbohydrate ABC transporter permease n=1 Tax=Actinospica acidithermotolerans TaxID=2828514 RepID=A0A941EDU1_9ACTN|nr:carbohydrate ABC transporter permease [Actinospica acidithermotolerans]MBR7827214.1 carbohydrate ABC transporter permease [Actinospica acidithermotolerans]